MREEAQRVIDEASRRLADSARQLAVKILATDAKHSPSAVEALAWSLLQQATLVLAPDGPDEMLRLAEARMARS